MSDLRTGKSSDGVFSGNQCPCCGCGEYEVTFPATQDFDDTRTEFFDFKCGSTQRFFQGEPDCWLALCPETKSND